MLNKELRETILCLHQKGKSSRMIAQLLKVSRNTIRTVLKEGIDKPFLSKKSEQTDLVPVLKEIFTRCQGNAIRIQEILKEEYAVEIAYSTLNRLIKENALRQPIKRVGEYCFEPGEEMQHDTSPHKLKLGNKEVKAQCASLVFAYSRKLFMKYYPCFTRFENKCFLKEALEFMQGSCSRCVIDNTSVVLAGGSGPNAVFAPEMLTFSQMFGFEFKAHRIGHSDRKARVERPFHYIEHNFLAGRTFEDWEDLNRQAREWCIQVNQKEKRILGMSPEAAFIKEKPYLIALPEVMPPIYEHYQRIVDSKGFVNLDTNRYSVPEALIGRTVDAYKYPEEVKVYQNHQLICVHPRLGGKRGHVSLIKSHHTRHHVMQTNQVLQKTEGALLGQDRILDLYIKELKKRVRGCGLRQLNRLLDFKRTYPLKAFLDAIEKANHYGLYDLNRLEGLIIKSVAGDYFNLKKEDD
jgi:transposase